MGRFINKEVLPVVTNLEPSILGPIDNKSSKQIVAIDNTTAYLQF